MSGAQKAVMDILAEHYKSCNYELITKNRDEAAQGTIQVHVEANSFSSMLGSLKQHCIAISPLKGHPWKALYHILSAREGTYQNLSNGRAPKRAHHHRGIKEGSFAT